MKIMLLMIITPPDSRIAEFTVGKLAKALHATLELRLYFNGLHPHEQRRIRRQVERNPHVRIADNYAEIAKNRESIAAQIGTAIVTADGKGREVREGFYEPQAEIWSRELVAFREYDLVGIVDPDFEILEPNFIDEILGAFATDDSLGFMSVDYSPAMEFYDSYSRESCILEERYHTWFCVYRRRALELENDFYFQEERAEILRKWDHSAALQAKLRAKHGYTGRVLRPEHQWKFLHYGAFAQNRNLTGTRLRVYRALRVGRHNGFIHLHGRRSLATAIQRGCEKAFTWLRMGRFDREREHYRFEFE